MGTKRIQAPRFNKTALIRATYGTLLFLLICGTLVAVAVIQTKEVAFDSAFKENSVRTAKVSTNIPNTFPIGVDPRVESIVENPTVDAYFDTYILTTARPRTLTRGNWIQTHILAQLAQFDWFQNLASPLSRILVIDAGERKEEVIKSFGDIMHWDAQERTAFAAIIASSSPALSEGKFYPGHYVVDKDATPEKVAGLVLEQFNANVTARYSPAISSKVPLNQALIIASLLEREAYDFEDMRYISGVIWNRLFNNMNLQIDASLQYAKATNTNTKSWWPPVRPSDKFIKSPYNTYKNSGLPPLPIASPSPEAILAALNPRETDCMFYFHDKNGDFHCTATYQEHVSLLKQYYGQGK